MRRPRNSPAMIRIDSKPTKNRASSRRASLRSRAPPAMAKLQVNVDHVATVRQARREAFPDPVRWALLAEKSGAQGITCHLRKDRRHIQDDDVLRLRKKIATRLNVETSLDPDILRIVSQSGADAVCIVPENRAEVTTEGGLDVVRERKKLDRAIPDLARRGMEVSLFVDPDLAQLEASAEAGAEFVELHTGAYARARGARRKVELRRLQEAARFAHEKGLRVNAGHGLDYDNVGPIAGLPHVEELNIGFAIVAHALEVGVREAIDEMVRAIRRASPAPRATRKSVS